MTSSGKLVVDVNERCDNDSFSLLIRFDEHVISSLQIGSEGSIIEDENRSEGVKAVLDKCLNLSITHEEKIYKIETKILNNVLGI